MTFFLDATRKVIQEPLPLRVEWTAVSDFYWLKTPVPSVAQVFWIWSIKTPPHLMIPTSNNEGANLNFPFIWPRFPVDMSTCPDSGWFARRLRSLECDSKVCDVSVNWHVQIGSKETHSSDDTATYQAMQNLNKLTIDCTGTSYKASSSNISCCIKVLYSTMYVCHLFSRKCSQWKRTFG